MNILMFSTYDHAGGAEKVASDLQRIYRSLGHDARLFVRYRRSQESHIYETDPYLGTSPWAPICRSLENKVRRVKFFRGQYKIVDFLRILALPGRGVDAWRGIDNFRNPSTYQIFNCLGDWHPDIIHAHNLHGDYFDFSALPELNQKVPFVWTLHDTWALTGHCGYFLECSKWVSGCGNCPDLNRPPRIRRDSTSANFRLKKKLYQDSRLFISTPSEWLLSYVQKSILSGQESKVIPNGIDLDVYKPANRNEARRILGLPDNAFICLYVSFAGAANNPYKDYTTVATAIQQLSNQRRANNIFFVCIGHSESVNLPNSRHTGYISDEKQIALYYQAADVLLHAANAENFPLVILEAMACGTPVIASNVGGISEQVSDSQTGFLVSRGDSNSFVDRILYLQKNPETCHKMGQLAGLQAKEKYSLDTQAKTYLRWFEDLRTNHP